MNQRDRLIELIDSFDVMSVPTDGFRHHLADYLISNGVIVPPCRVGDTVYCILEDAPVYYPDTNGWYISTETVYEITSNGLILCEVEEGANVYIDPFDQIGKTIFLTREQAENVLKEVGKV